MIRVLVADDHPVVRQGICAMLEVEPDLEVVADVGDGTQAVDLTLARSPDVVLMDVQMPGLDGIEVPRAVKDSSTVVVLLTAFSQRSLIENARDAGVAA